MRSESTASDVRAPGGARLRARLGRLGAVRDASVAAATRVTLQVAFEGGAPEHGAVFDGVAVALGEGEARLGRCRFDAGGPPGWDGRLVFLDDVYDCRALVRDGAVVGLAAAFHGLPLVLSQKGDVRPEFKRFLADTLYDLGAYQRFFDEQEAALADEPSAVAEAARAALVRAEEPRFFAFMEAHLRELAAQVEGFGREEHARHAFYLRRVAWPFIERAPFLWRSNAKPRGYAGDAESMLVIYENAYQGRTAFDRLLHKHSVSTAAADAVRSRRRLVPRAVREAAAAGGAAARPFRFLSLAAGPAAELDAIFAEPADLERFHATLLDQDPFALDLARRTVARIEAAHGGRAPVRYLEDSVRTMLRTRDLAGRFGRYHLVYSMGLFDYLTPPVARAVLARTWELVVPGGTMLVGNFHERNPSRIYMDYWGDWPLYYRDEAGLLGLAEGLDGEREITFDETGAQMFLRLRKPG